METGRSDDERVVVVVECVKPCRLPLLSRHATGHVVGVMIVPMLRVGSYGELQAVQPELVDGAIEQLGLVTIERQTFVLACLARCIPAADGLMACARVDRYGWRRRVGRGNEPRVCAPSGGFLSRARQ